MVTFRPPPGSVTEAALPGALMLTSRSDPLVVSTEKNRLAVPPGCSFSPSGAPSTKTFLISRLPALVVWASVGTRNSSVGA